ncbi:predicted protein [Postia placenta Mad-698-R]|nr:predicted protein [Postia placenta Mad-698-R]
MYSIIEKRLWQDEQRILPVARVQFQQKVGWSQTAKQIFETLRFPMSIVPGTEEPGVCPPVIDPSISEGKQNRARLLRAWVEMSAWLTIYQKNSTALWCSNVIKLATVPRSLTLVGVNALDFAWKELGMTPAAYSQKTLVFAYFAQCRCDPVNTPRYFTALCQIAQALGDIGAAAPELQQIIIKESCHRYAPEKITDAIEVLGLSRERGPDTDVDDQSILEAWWSARCRLDDALRILADRRGSMLLWKAWVEQSMTPLEGVALCRIIRNGLGFPSSPVTAISAFSYGHAGIHTFDIVVQRIGKPHLRNCNISRQFGNRNGSTSTASRSLGACENGGVGDNTLRFSTATTYFTKRSNVPMTAEQITKWK